MDIIVKFLFYSGRYLIVVTTQSFIEALKKSSQMKTKIMERIDKSFDVIGCHENMLQLINDNFESIGSAANIQLAFISDKHRVEFERYLKNLEKSAHGVEINDQLTRVIGNGFTFPYQNKITSSIINQYTSKDGFNQQKFATTSTRKNEKNSDCPNEFFNSTTSTQEVFGNEDVVNFSEQKYVYMNELPIPKLDVDEEISINNSENELTEPGLSNRSNSSDMSCELQESPIRSQLFDYDNKALASVIVLNNDKKTHYLVKNPITDLCKDLELNLKCLINKKARNLLTSTSSQTLVKLMNNKTDESVSCKMLNNLMSRSSEFGDLKPKPSFGAGNSTEAIRNNERISSLEVDFSKLFHQNSESFRIFERRLHDIRIKRSLDELRNERIREIHNIKGDGEFSETNEKSLTEKAMKQIIKDLSHNLDATIRKLAAYDTRFNTIERKLKQLEQLSISSSKSNMRDLLSEISVGNEIELLNDDVKKIENEIVVDELNRKDSPSKRSEIPIPKSIKKEGAAKVQNFPPNKNSNQQYANKIRTNFTRKLNKNTFVPKKTYFHSIKHSGHSGKSQLTDSIQNYQKNILRLPFNKPPNPLPSINDDEVIEAKKIKQNTQPHKLKRTSKLDLLTRTLLPETLTECDLTGQSTTELNESKGTELKLQEHVSENNSCNAEELETEREMCIFNDSVLCDDESVDISTSIKQESTEVKQSNAATGFDEVYDSMLDVEPVDLPQCIEDDTKDLHLEQYENDPNAEYFHINQTADNCAVPPNTDKFDEIIIEDADGLDAEKSQILSSEELNVIEGSSEIQNYINQLSHKLDKSMKLDSESNLDFDLLATVNFKSEDATETDLKLTTNNEEPSQDDGIVKDASSDYISDMNSALQNYSKSHVQLFSTIDLSKYDTIDSDEPLAYKDAIMSNNISIKQAPRIQNEKIIIDEYTHYDIKKAKEHIINKEVIKRSTSDKMVNFEEINAHGITLNVDKGFEEIEPSGDYEFQKIQEHVKNLDKVEALGVLSIDEMLKKELIRCCIGKPNHLDKDNIDKAREHLVNKSIKTSSLINDSTTTPVTDYEKISTFQYEIKKALEHFKTKDAIKLKPLTLDIEKNDLEISPTLSWNSEITTEDETLPKVSHKASILDIHDAELDEMYPKIDGEEEIVAERSISKIHKNENKNDENANVKSESLNNITNYNCITRENENALEGILLNINNIISDKNIRACKEQVEVNNGVEQSSKTSTSKDESTDCPEEKYMKMYNLLKSIKETIQAHKIRVEQTIKNYEDLFQQNIVEVPIQEQGDVDGTAPSHNSMDHLDHRQVNLIADAVVQEDIQGCEVTKVHYPKSTTPLVNRENFRTMMSDFLKKHKQNEEFIQSLKKFKCKPIGNNLGRVQYKSFLNEYSQQFSDLHEQITAIAGPIVKTDYKGTAKADGSSEEYLQNKASINVKQLEKGMFEDQISKLSIETEKNRSNAANKNIPIASTRISLPMLQRENLEIDKMIEVNKKAFSELESSLKVVKLIGSNTSGNLSTHSVLEELCVSPKSKSQDKNIIVLHDNKKFKQSQAETISINESAKDSSIKANEPRICSSDCVNFHLQEQNDVFGLSTRNCCVNSNSEKHVLKQNDDNITINRKCIDKEFHRDKKHSGHNSLKQHEVKKKEYHTRCTNMSKDPKDEDKRNTDGPTALIVTNNTEIPIQMMPMIDDSIFLNNFNIDKSLITFEEPHKNLIRIHDEIGCNEDYLKESITENTLFKNLINLEEVRKFFGFNERKTLAENEDKHSLEAVKELDDLKKSDQKPILKGTQVNALGKKENDMFKSQYINANKIAAEENIEIIKQQSLRKRHIETKHIDTRTQVEIEKSILNYKERFNKQRQVKAPKWAFSNETPQNVNIIKQLEDFISATDSPKNDSAPNVNAVQFKNKSETNLETNNSVLVLDPPEKKLKSNSLPVQNVQKQSSVEGYVNKTELGNMDCTQQGDITQNDIIQVEEQIEELLQATKNFTKTQNDFKAIDNVTKETNRARTEQEKNNVQVVKSKKYSTQSHLQEVKLNRDFYERNELRDEEFTDSEDTVTSKSLIDKKYRTSTPNLNQIKNNIQQSQEEYIFIEPTRVVRNENIAGMFQIEDISDRKANVFAERTDTYEHNMKSKSGLHEHYREHVNPIYRIEHSDAKFVQSNVYPSEIKDDHEKNSIPSTNNKFEQFLEINKVDPHTTSPYIDAVQNNKPFKFSKSKHEAFFKDGKKFSNAGHLVNRKHESIRKMRNHLKSMGEINKNSEQTQRQFENIYKQIKAFDPEQSKTYPESENVSITEELIDAPKKAELSNQINILPQKIVWSQDYNARKKLWKRLQHVKKLANEKNAEKLYVLGTKLPTLKTNTLRTSRISEKLLPIKKPIQYQYQVKKVRVGDRIMNITYLVEVAESKV